MTSWSRRMGVLAVLATAACAATTPAGRASDAPLTPAQQAAADGGRPAYTRADVHFMQGMIGHHAQAITMARWATTHGASEQVKVLAGRIDVSQRDEIAFMQRWLRERGEQVPPADAQKGAGHEAHGAGHAMMPGMLTAEELAQLDAARGIAFDRLFLGFMIRHHEGALTMVQQLFASPGAGQDGEIFRFASDVEADQDTEIERMRSMLRARQ